MSCSLKCLAWSDHKYFASAECIYGFKFDHNHNPPQYLNECLIILIAYVTMVGKSGHNLCIFKGALGLARFGQIAWDCIEVHKCCIVAGRTTKKLYITHNMPMKRSIVLLQPFLL